MGLVPILAQHHSAGLAAGVTLTVGVGPHPMLSPRPWLLTEEQWPRALGAAAAPDARGRCDPHADVVQSEGRGRARTHSLAVSMLVVSGKTPSHLRWGLGEFPSYHTFPRPAL